MIDLEKRFSRKRSLDLDLSVHSLLKFSRNDMLRLHIWRRREDPQISQQPSLAVSRIVHNTHGFRLSTIFLQYPNFTPHVRSPMLSSFVKLPLHVHFVLFGSTPHRSIYSVPSPHAPKQCLHYPPRCPDNDSCYSPRSVLSSSCFVAPRIETE